jgi:oxaloacetate decarboxylase alpha subunit
VGAEVETVTADLIGLADQYHVELGCAPVVDVLICAMFPQAGWRFLQGRGNPAALESLTGDDPVGGTAAVVVIADSPKEHAVKVNGRVYNVEVAPGASVALVMAAATRQCPGGETVRSLMAGDLLRINITQGLSVCARSRGCHGSHDDGDGDGSPSRWYRRRETGNDWRRRDRYGVLVELG